MLNRSLSIEVLFWTAWLVAAGWLGGLAMWAREEYYLPGDRAVTFGVQDLYTQSGADTFFENANRAGDPWVLALVLGAMGLILLGRRRAWEVMLVGAGGLALLVATVVGEFTQRPDFEYLDMRASFEGLFHPRIYPDPGGFPSGHVYGEVLVYGLLLVLAPRILPWRWPMLAARVLAALTIITGFIAPMYLGTHWSSDCAGAALLGLLVVAPIWRADVFARRDQVLIRVEDIIGRRTVVRSTVSEARRPLRTR